mmetsp:Transcript_24902/g.59130  ORF Transcript_24902/g.59130 Transcript_24902/m.59130 type:complete len:213 (-) Transcript_24902:379-1017(-)
MAARGRRAALRPGPLRRPPAPHAGYAAWTPGALRKRSAEGDDGSLEIRGLSEPEQTAEKKVLHVSEMALGLEGGRREVQALAQHQDCSPQLSLPACPPAAAASLEPKDHPASGVSRESSTLGVGMLASHLPEGLGCMVEGAEMAGTGEAGAKAAAAKSVPGLGRSMAGRPAGGSAAPPVGSLLAKAQSPQRTLGPALSGAAGSSPSSLSQGA